MRKGIGVILIALAVFIGLFVSDVYRYRSTVPFIKKIKIEFQEPAKMTNKTGKRNIIVNVSENTLSGPTRITVSADNRFLELMTESHKQADGVTYEGRKAGVSDSIFSFSGDARLELAFYQKETPPGDFPFLYAYVETEVASVILDDQKLYSELFPFHE